MVLRYHFGNMGYLEARHLLCGKVLSNYLIRRLYKIALDRSGSLEGTKEHAVRPIVSPEY